MQKQPNRSRCSGDVNSVGQETMGPESIKVKAEVQGHKKKPAATKVSAISSESFVCELYALQHQKSILGVDFFVRL